MPSRSPATPDVPVLSLRELNRALLSRQLLLERARLAPDRAIERLGALQAQSPPAPYIALWSRLAPFARDDLERALRSGRVVKATLMRGTLHLASARDYPSYAVAAPLARRALWPSTQRQLVAFLARQLPEARAFAREGRLPIEDPERLHAALLRFCARPRSRDELIAFIAERARVPGALAKHLVWGFVAAHGLVVHEAESALFTTTRGGRLIAARAALPGVRVPDATAAVTHTVQRHLAAFGPAAIGDVASWTHIANARIRDALVALGARVRLVRDDRGRTLYDLARAPRPPAETPAPVRFLPKWDSAILAYAPPARDRILPERLRRIVIVKNGDVVPTVLVDGTVAARWDARVVDGTALVTVEPFVRIARAERAAIAAEGERLARFVHPDAGSYGVRITPITDVPRWNLGIRP